MTPLIHIYLAAAHHPAFRCGGWAVVRSIGGQPTGAAGGARATSAQRMALSGLIWALRDLPAGADATLHTTNPDLALTEVLAGTVNPDEDLDLWAQVQAAAKGRRFTVTAATAAPDTPLAFAAAWADLAMDKAKMGGAFTAAIPKANLAKVVGL
jgi:hypothetical protein